MVTQSLVLEASELWPVIDNKKLMYELLGRGSFGNTIPYWLDEEDWEKTAPKMPVWGVRTMTPGGPCRLFCPEDEVKKTCQEYRQAGYTPQISAMIDCVGAVTLMAEVWDSPTGLIVHGIDMPEKGANWRRDMPAKAKMYEGVAARRLLKQRLNPNSYEDLCDLLELWPDHVIEFSVMDRCFGTNDHRNTIVWELRGSY